MHEDKATPVTRRDALIACAATAIGAAWTAPDGAEAADAGTPSATPHAASKYQGEYSGERLNRVAFPMGGPRRPRVGRAGARLEALRTVGHGKRSGRAIKT